MMHLVMVMHLVMGGGEGVMHLVMVMVVMHLMMGGGEGTMHLVSWVLMGQGRVGQGLCRIVTATRTQRSGKARAKVRCICCVFLYRRVFCRCKGVWRYTGMVGDQKLETEEAGRQWNHAPQGGQSHQNI